MQVTYELIHWGILRVIGVAAAFGLCGYLSAAYLLSEWPGRRSLMLPVPFALLCALLFLHKAQVAVAAPLMVGVWLVANHVATFVLFRTDVVSAACGAGLIGGLGLALCVSLCYRRVRTWRHLFVAALVGNLSSLPFVPWMNLYVSHYDPIGANPKAPPLAFAVWQATVGTYLYAACNGWNWWGER